MILAGNIDLAASSSRGEVKLSGRDAATWVDRILEGTLGSCSVSAGGAEPPKRTAMYELQGGVVPGVGITLVAGGHVVATAGRRAPGRQRSEEMSPGAAARRCRRCRRCVERRVGTHRPRRAAARRGARADRTRTGRGGCRDRRGGGRRAPSRPLRRPSPSPHLRPPQSQLPLPQRLRRRRERPASRSA